MVGAGGWYACSGGCGGMYACACVKEYATLPLIGGVDCEGGAEYMDHPPGPVGAHEPDPDPEDDAKEVEYECEG